MFPKSIDQIIEQRFPFETKPSINSKRGQQFNELPTGKYERTTCRYSIRH